MFISTVYSYLGGWEKLKNHESGCLDDIKYALNMFTPDNLSKRHVTQRFHGNSDRQPIFSTSFPLALKFYLKNKEWTEIESSSDYSEFSHGIKHVMLKRNIPIKLIANIKKPFFSNWLIYETPIMYCAGKSDVSILLVPNKDILTLMKDKNKTHLFTIDDCRELLQKLSPLKTNSPFVIMSFTSNKESHQPEIFELKPLENSINNHSLSVERAIEFPQQYFEAGLAIMEEFNTYLKESYPNENVKVRIEQDKLQVKLVIETLAGDPVVISKALDEYSKDISAAHGNIRHQNQISMAMLSQLVVALTNREQPNIYITNNTSSQSESKIIVNQSISSAIGSANEIIEAFTKNNNSVQELDSLVGELESLEKEGDQAKIRKSGAMSKFGRLVKSISDSNSTLRKALNELDSGKVLAQDLCEKYNSIADWCGLPQVPKVLLKKKHDK